MDRLYTPGRHAAFPDAGEYYATVGPDSVAAFAARTFVEHNRMLTVVRPFPVDATLLAGLAGLVLFSAVRTYRALAFRPADMTTIRYLARIRPPRLWRLARAVLLTAAAAVTLRLLVAATHYLLDPAVVAVDSFVLPVIVAAGALFAAATAGLAMAGRIHHKVLVFHDEIRFKSPTYRAVIVPGTGVAGARARDGSQDVRLRNGPAGLRKGVVVALRDGTGFLVPVRNPAALEAAVNNLAARCAGAESPDPGAGGLTRPEDPAIPTGGPPPTA
jgi:hypothetical protein